MIRSASRQSAGLLLLAGLLCGAAPTARGAAALQMAGPEIGFAAATSGPRAASWNPALLALHPARRLEIFSFRGGISNNSCSITEYAKLNGAYWDDDEKSAILAQVDAAGVTLEGDARLSALGLSLSGMAFSTETRGASNLTLPRDALEILFYGNAVGETYDLDGSDGEGIAFTEWRFSFARPLGDLFATGPPILENWSIGVSVKLFEGWVFGELIEAEGNVTTTAECVYGGGRLRSRLARGGRGYGFDLGLAGRLGEVWTLSLAARDLAAALEWTVAAEERIDEFDLPGVSLGSNGSATVTGESVSRPLRSIRTALPPVFSVGAAHRGQRLLTACHLEIATRDRFGASREPRLALGAAWRVFGRTTLRGALEIGGAPVQGIGVGIGSVVGPVQLDLGLQTRGTLNLLACNGLGLTAALGVAF